MKQFLTDVATDPVLVCFACFGVVVGAVVGFWWFAKLVMGLVGV